MNFIYHVCLCTELEVTPKLGATRFGEARMVEFLFIIQVSSTLLCLILKNANFFHIAKVLKFAFIL